MAEKKHTQDPLDMEEALSTSEAFIIKYKSRILGAIAAVVIIIAGFMGYKHSSLSRMKSKLQQLYSKENNILETTILKLHWTVTASVTKVFWR